RTGHDPESMDLQLYALDVELGQIGRALDVALCRCERGHLALAMVRSAHDFITQTRHIAEQATVGPTSPLGRAIARLEQAQLAWDYGQTLIAGERHEDIPEGLRARLQQSKTP
ncbi:MAG: hypothetical protein AAFX99_37390, partial [Myxococcota bacterium]